MDLGRCLRFSSLVGTESERVMVRLIFDWPSASRRREMVEDVCFTLVLCAAVIPLLLWRRLTAIADYFELGPSRKEK